MTPTEKSLLKAFLHNLVDTQFPALIAAEISKLPAIESGIVNDVTQALLPRLLSALDTEIDTKLA